MLYTCERTPFSLVSRKKARWRRFACTRTRVQLQCDTVGMICRRIAGPLVGQESRLRLMPINGLGKCYSEGVNTMLTASPFFV